ncbi:hypothetical protein [Bowmanella dokdonensis]|uniref:Uncharacterized protein n=1 Tax=Bowmanella dokdonensis TaxID=751969 RepID=A0A939DJU1_9ALTE|nr:hypothetical protein [Bowmanella dokdonensis]MBN7824028.1 hypothetical protein [Bowmanella dokdonensis]
MRNPLVIIPALLAIVAASQPLAQQSECPAGFHDMPMMPEARFCQLFDGGVPASLSYFVALAPAQALSFYQQELGEQDARVESHRYVMEKANWVVVISPDGTGSQIDILIKH